MTAKPTSTSLLIAQIQAVEKWDWSNLLRLGREASSLPLPDRIVALAVYARTVDRWRGRAGWETKLVTRRAEDSTSEVA